MKRERERERELLVGLGDDLEREKVLTIHTRERERERPSIPPTRPFWKPEKRESREEKEIDVGRRSFEDGRVRDG